MNATFRSLSLYLTVNWLRMSARAVPFTGWMPFDCTESISVVVFWLANCGGALDRTRSAHDFGVARVCGEEGFGVSVDPSASPFVGSSLLPLAGSLEVTASGMISTDLVDSGFEAVESLFEGREREGMLGIAGIIGTTFDVGRAAGAETVGREGMAEDGVVGCVESVSDGACEVAGVSELVISTEAGGTEETGEVLTAKGSGSARGCSVVDSWVFFEVRCGSSTGVLED